MDAKTLAACTGSTLALAQKFVEPLSAGMAFYGIDTAARRAMFLANVGHESGRLVFTTELWGPTPAQVRYDGRADLGNTQPGDGSRYRGRGLIQTTGRSNYASVTRRLRDRFPALGVPDFESMPDRLAEPQWAALSACDYVDMRGLNDVADKEDFLLYVKRINGGTNGLADRQTLYAASLKALA